MCPTNGAQLDLSPQSFFPEHFKLGQFHGFPDTRNNVFCAKRISSQRFSFSRVKMAPGPETCCFRIKTCSEVFLLGVGNVFSVKNVSSERFSLARFWAKRVFSEKAPLVLFHAARPDRARTGPSPDPVLTLSCPCPDPVLTLS